MDKTLSPTQRELYRRIDEVLFYKWDPIGISDSDWDRDEYQVYLPQVFRLVLENESPEPIAEYLTKVASERMGLGKAAKHDLDIAELVLSIKEKCLE
ncbi:hypothetical protein IMCC21906_01641 [Spongiibacter sp. IMCC21906]|uniref:hypothetical protein n=1 Tax=Spongiibacter sp. IMCC21906 TaxID=1620392 RepID=UPI00062DD997|nr:hypothetical protein [Spongiibacter sp. IMCC21906]AKH69318.1 hypothetical protein IMCC21906_01641 [Spongiibacter sp. IMCC21906]